MRITIVKRYVQCGARFAPTKGRSRIDESIALPTEWDHPEDLLNVSSSLLDIIMWS